MLRGSVDLIEHRADLDVLRVTDHKTGKNRSNPDLIVGGGGCCSRCSTAWRSSRGSARRSSTGRLFYCTTAGGFAEHDDSDQRLHARAGPAGARDHRSRRRERIPAGGAGRARLHVVRLPAGLRPARGRAHQAQGARPAGRSRGAAGRCDDTAQIRPARTPTTTARATPSPTSSTRRSSSKPRPAPARRPSW